jgi:energy-coupling factor transporter ATP-binding protein EcfA2
LCLIVRAVLEKPELLLLDEDTLDFGLGLEHNLAQLFELSEETTLLAITKSNLYLDRYDKVMLMDAGYVLSGGTLEEQLRSEDSYLCKYLEETDPRALGLLLAKYGLQQIHKEQRSMKRNNRFTVLHKNSAASMDPSETERFAASVQQPAIKMGASSQVSRNESMLPEPESKISCAKPSKIASEWRNNWMQTGLFPASPKNRTVSPSSISPHGLRKASLESMAEDGLPQHLPVIYSERKVGVDSCVLADVSCKSPATSRYSPPNGVLEEHMKPQLAKNLQSNANEANERGLGSAEQANSSGRKDVSWMPSSPEATVFRGKQDDRYAEGIKEVRSLRVHSNNLSGRTSRLPSRQSSRE